MAKIEYSSMLIRIPEKEMSALWHLQKKTGITRTQLIREGLDMMFRSRGVDIEMAEMKVRSATIPPSGERKPYRHAREFMQMSIKELMEK